MKLTKKKSNCIAPRLSAGDSSEYSAVIEQLIHRFSPLDKTLDRLPLLHLAFPSHDTLSLSLLCFDHPQAGKFFYDMVMRYLMPLKALTLSRVFLSPFYITSCDRRLLIGDISLQVVDKESQSEIVRRFNLLKGDVLFGLRSPYYASRMLELKALSLDDKHALIQDKLAAMINRFPHWYSFDLFSWMQRFFLAVPSDYLRTHEVRQVAQTIAFFSLLEKKLLLGIESANNRRHVYIKVFSRRYHSPLGIKQVVSLAIGMTFLRDNEVFTRRHLGKAIASITQELKIIDKTDFLYRAKEHPFEVLYLECLPKNERAHVPTLIQELRKELLMRVKERIEHVQHPLFMPRNEEEVMRYIVTLGREVRFSRDVPQVIISFGQQTDQRLLFTAIIVRAVLAHSPSSSELLTRLSTFEPQLERIKVIGQLRKKYPKEALVLKMALPSDQFLRENQSVDLYRARQAILSGLEGALGEVRDYNGGMIAKQNEVFRDLVARVGEKGKGSKLLMENFFHALYPIERRASLKPEELSLWFLLLLRAIHLPFAGKQSELYVREEGETLAIVISCVDRWVKEKISTLIAQLKEILPDLISFQLSSDENHFLGYLDVMSDQEKKAHFLAALRQMIELNNGLLLNKH